MRKSFDKSKLINQYWNIEGIDKDIPIFFIKPQNNNIKKALIYIPGLNGNGSMIRFYNFTEFQNDCLLFSFDPRSQGNNKNKASRFYKKYVKDISLIILEFKKRFTNISEIYLCGESWGSTLSILAYQKNSKLIKGVVGWNMPYNVVDVSMEKGWAKFKRVFKVLLTFATSLNTYDESPLSEKLTNNELIKKIIKLVQNKKLNNKVSLAAWRSFKKSWMVLEKENLNIKYIQSLEDAMLSRKGKDKISKISKVKIFEKGYHILSFDDNVQEELFYEIFNFIDIK